jgi:hypothetical protein
MMQAEMEEGQLVGKTDGTVVWGGTDGVEREPTPMDLIGIQAALVAAEQAKTVANLAARTAEEQIESAVQTAAKSHAAKVAELEQKIKGLGFNSQRTLCAEEDGRSARDVRSHPPVEDGGDDGLPPAAQLANTLSVLTQLLKETSQGRGGTVQEQESHEPVMQVPVTLAKGTIRMTPLKNRAKLEKVRGFKYMNTLSASAVESAGDGNFAAPRQKWGRLGNDAPIFEAEARVMMPYAFKETAAAEYEDVCSKKTRSRHGRTLDTARGQAIQR